MEDEDNSGWQLTESDPGVFTELLKNLGVPLMVDEIYSLDSDVLADYDPISALVFLFKWVASGDEKGLLEGAKYDEEFDGFFAHQTVQNACATLAVINALGNIPGIEMGQQLKDLLGFTQEMDPQTCGLSITSSLFLREAHNSLSPPPSLSLAGLRPKSKETEDAYHFVVYLPINGCLYELDGLKSWPVNHGVVQPNAEGWLATARDTIQKRIATYPAGSIHFNLQALHTDPLPGLERELEHHQSSNNTIMIPSITNRIAEEKAKRERWAFENSLRRHNHIGLAYGLLYALASVGALDEATTMAKDKLKLRRQKAAKEGMMEED